MASAVPPNLESSTGWPKVLATWRGPSVYLSADDNCKMLIDYGASVLRKRSRDIRVSERGTPSTTKRLSLISSTRWQDHKVSGSRRETFVPVPKPLIDTEALKLSQRVVRLVVVPIGDVGANLIGPIEAEHSLVPEGDTVLSAANSWESYELTERPHWEARRRSVVVGRVSLWKCALLFGVGDLE